MGQRQRGALQHVGFLARQIGQRGAFGHLGIDRLEQRVGRVEIALTAIAQFDPPCIGGIGAEFQQGADIDIGDAFGPGGDAFAILGRGGVDVGIVAFGLVQVQIGAERQHIGDRPGGDDIGAIGRAFVLAFGQFGKEGGGGFPLDRGLGDDVHDAASRAGAVARRRRAANDLDPLDRGGRHPVAVATGVPLARAAHPHGVARQGRTPVDQDQGVFRSHPAQVDLTVVAALAGGGVAGQIDARLGFHQFGHVIGNEIVLNILGGDGRGAERLFQLLRRGVDDDRAEIGVIAGFGLFGRGGGLRLRLRGHDAEHDKAAKRGGGQHPPQGRMTRAERGKGGGGRKDA